ncbi:hypothetical protein CLV43_11419 [Umezawaea tangerina]|uniref:TrbL/VirB6 plasmid conjugal transfer protein n=1 Tax=Umezawaea tangerina TaxID=84725 RepID=A0A2T0SNW4_9PSEU|nr:hypothetical protein CLV43_11419 [Umezawaea tangerina]
MLAPPSVSLRQAHRIGRIFGFTRSRALVALEVSLVVLLGGSLASAALGPHSGPQVVPVAAAQLPLPLPTVDPDPCGPGSPPMPICTLPRPTTTLPMTGLPLPTAVPTLPPCDPTLPLQQCAPTGTTPSTPCSGEGCIPRPGATTTLPTTPGNGQPGQGQATEDDCGITDIGACVTESINGFFQGLVTDALNPLLDLLSTTLLTTPMPDSLPRVGELWDNSWQILLVSYGLLVLIAGVIAMSYQSLQTRHSIKELAPRLVVGFLAGALSLWVATKGIQIANAVVEAVMDGGVDADSAARTLRNMVVNSTTQGGVWIAFIGIVLAGLLVALLITYAVRVAVTIILIGGAPLAMMFHALPQTEGIAYWWWKTYGGCLAIQVGQSLALITALKVFLAPGGFGLFGPTDTGLVNLLVAIALIYILFKIPFWVMSSIRGGGGGRSLLGSVVKGFLAYKTFGLLGGRGNRTPYPAGRARAKKPPSPFARTRTTSTGQYILPLPGVRRVRSGAKKSTAPATPTGKAQSGNKAQAKGRASSTSPSVQGKQLALPLGDDWPENKPVLGRDGQYRLPLDVKRTKATPPGAAATPSRPGRRGGVQLELPFDPFKGNRPTRSGQYPLPLEGVRRTPRPMSPPPPPPSRGRNRVVQPELPFDPYKGNRADRGGQYPLPLEGVRRVPAPNAAPAPPPVTPPRPVSRAGRQLRLPLDLPKPSKPPTTAPVFSSPPAVPPKPKPGGKTS